MWDCRKEGVGGTISDTILVVILPTGGRRAILLFLLPASVLSAQQPLPAPVFHTGSDLVQINVVARDQRGRPVADLRREEFQVFDNGVLQEINLFIGERDQSIPPQPVRGANTFTNAISAPAGPRSGYSVILIDDLYSGSDPTGEEGSTLSRVRALELLRSISEGERIAIYALGIKFRVICEFTSDRELLERQLRKWKPTPTTPAPEPHSSLPGPFDPQQAQMAARAAAEFDRIDMAQRSDLGDFQLTALADHLAGIPGRKKLIWLANKFPISPRALQSLNRAGVSIYPVDIDGVCRVCPERPFATMDAIAAATGGLAYYSRNDLAVAMREALDDGRVSYTLGFYASRDVEDPAPPHRLRVKVTRPGIELRYGTIYQPAPPPPSSLTFSDLARAMNRPVDATAIPIQASVTRVKDHLNLEVSLAVDSLDLVPEQDRWTGTIEFAARFTSADAIVASDPIAQTATFHLSRRSYDAALREGVAYHNEFEIPPHADHLKLLFANTASGKIGTLTIPLSNVKASAAR